MKILYILLAFSLSILSINSVFGYSCYDHYSDKYCDKLLGKKPTEPTVSVTTSDLEIVQTNSTINRETIDDLERKKILAENDLKKLKEDLVLNEASILSLESSLNFAELEQSRAKELHKSEPSETTRIALVKADEKVLNAEKTLNEAKVKREEIINKISENSSLIANLKETINQQEKTVSKEKKISKSGLQTIGIKISNSCILMLKNDIKSPCPTYATLMALNLDTSDKRSGEFKFVDGYYHRQKPLLKNDDKLYNLNDYNIIIDPSSALQTKIKTITITPNLNNYLLPEDLVKINNTRIIHKDRYVDSCRFATINAGTWLQTLADTVQYLRNNCANTLLNTVDVITDNATVTNIEHSSKYKIDTWYKTIKETHKTLKINNDTSSNKSVTEDEDQ